MIEALFFVIIGFVALWMLFKIAVLLFGSAAIGTTIYLKSKAPTKNKIKFLFIILIIIIVMIKVCGDDYGLRTYNPD